VKVLTAAQMREVDRRTSELGVPSLILMENAGDRVLEIMSHIYMPLHEHRIAVICGKGNNGGDGLVVARQLYTRIRPRALHVVMSGDPKEMKGDAAENYRMLQAVGCQVTFDITPEIESATLIVDALLGTGIHGGAEGRSLELIRAINNGFPIAEVISIDLPSGLDSDSSVPPGEAVQANHTVTFTAPKPCLVLSPASRFAGKLHVAAIGSPLHLYENDASIYLSLSTPSLFTHLFRPRVPDSNKGMYGHVLVIAGARGKTGAASMAGMAALRAGAGLVTVASAESAIAQIASYAPEMMTEPLPETDIGSISMRALDHSRLAGIAERKNVVALGPGMGGHPETVQLIRRLVEDLQQPMVVDADALNALGHKDLHGYAPRILTPHPGEMARLSGNTVPEVQADRIGVARSFAQERGAYLVLKGNSSIIAAPDGRVWINPTGSPAMATGGTGDVLTGLIAGLLAQFPEQLEAALLAAVYLHGRAGELGAVKLGEKCFIATDLFQFLPEAMREVANLSHQF
jgi:hydroxyethylthiazole kinase-like uncharacterized protein yjeF